MKTLVAEDLRKTEVKPWDFQTERDWALRMRERASARPQKESLQLQSAASVSHARAEGQARPWREVLAQLGFLRT